MQAIELYPGVVSDPAILDGKPVIVGTYTAPETRWHAGGFSLYELDELVRNVVGNVDSTIHAVDIDSLLERGWEPPRPRHGVRPTSRCLPPGSLADRRR